jgi:hypothetical protein
MMMSNQTIDMTPTWETAAMIYCQVLQNPDASASAREDAQADLIRLGQYVDRLQAKRKENDDA